MKHLPILAVILALASCAPAIPRAILLPPGEVKALDVAPVSKATEQTREAVREIAKAGTETRRATDSLRDQIDRAAELATPYPDLREPFAEMQRRADLLAARVAVAEQKEAIAISTVDTLSAEVSAIKATSAAQAVQIRQSQATEATLRGQVESLNALPEKLAKAEQKAETLAWWTWRLAILSGALAAIIAGLAYLILKP